MTKTVGDVMTSQPTQLDVNTTITEAARAMRDGDIGTVVVTNNGSVAGIVTDRDIIVRAIANGDDPSTTQLGTVCSKDITSVAPQTSLADAVVLMRQHSIRRLPVMQDGTAVGIVSIGDFAIELDSHSALADISAASPNT